MLLIQVPFVFIYMLLYSIIHQYLVFNCNPEYYRSIKAIKKVSLVKIWIPHNKILNENRGAAKYRI
jgi:hypothetical protein